MNFLELSHSVASYCDSLHPVSSSLENLTGWAWNDPLAELRRTEEAIRTATRPAVESFDWTTRALIERYTKTYPAGDESLASSRAALSRADLAQGVNGWRELSEGFTRYQSVLEQSQSLIRQASVLSTGLASSLESQCGPWIRTSALTDPMLSSWLHGPGIVEAIEAALRPWKDVLGHLGIEFCPPSDEFVPLYRFLLARSWYLSADAPAGLVLDLADLHDAGDEAGIEDCLCAYFRPRLDEIENEIAASYPLHRPVTTDAFAIHGTGKYTLSIPALFIISDMIAVRLLESPFFCFKENKRQAESKLSSSLRPTTEPSLLALFERGGLRKNTRRMLPTDRTFNRHGVVHGAHAGWHTEANSLRCIALVEYLHSLTSLLTPETVALPS